MYRSGKQIFKQNPEIAQRLDECVKNLVQSFKPERIILFGDYARGVIQKDNTFDFLIIAKTSLRFFDRIKRALIVCAEGEPAIDPIVYTPDEFDVLWNQGEGFLEDALDEGIEVYKKESEINSENS
jgi:hypothetical protein